MWLKAYTDLVFYLVFHWRGSPHFLVFLQNLGFMTIRAKAYHPCHGAVVDASGGSNDINYCSPSPKYQTTSEISRYIA